MSIIRGLQEHLTADPTDAAAHRSHPGMAHWAGTGPTNTACRGCAYWFPDHTKGSKPLAQVKRARCRKYARLMQTETGPMVPGCAMSCRHFKARNCFEG
jgi:hypothetical protein